MRESIDQYCCTKCSFYEKLDRDYLDYIKKDIRRSEDVPEIEGILPCLGSTITEEDSDDSCDYIRVNNHSYHLSWAVFKHLPCKYCHIDLVRRSIAYLKTYFISFYSSKAL